MQARVSDDGVRLMHNSMALCAVKCDYTVEQGSAHAMNTRLLVK